MEATKKLFFWVAEDDTVAAYRRGGKTGREIALALAEGLTVMELFAEVTYWREMGEEEVADELLDLIEMPEEDLSAPEGGGEA